MDFSQRMGERLQQLSEWARRALKAHCGADCADKLQVVPLPGDAGFRRYYRCNTDPTLIAVDAPPSTENNARFVALADYLRRYGIHTPQVVAADIEQGFMLLEDLGDDQLFTLLDEDSAQSLYAEALSELLCLQQVPRCETLLQPYDREKLATEIGLFRPWFCESMLGVQLDDAAVAILDAVTEKLLASALEQPTVMVHRDYHSRNIMIREAHRPGIVDFQDAVWGPVTYDLAGLLRDCYVRWPREQVEHWALTYADMAISTDIMPEVTREQFLRWFDWMGMQRHLKVLGIFSRLWLRDGKPGYLRDLPLVMRYTLEVAEAYDEFADFARWFRDTLVPAAESQSWYRDWRTAGVAGRAGDVA